MAHQQPEQQPTAIDRRTSLAAKAGTNQKPMSSDLHPGVGLRIRTDFPRPAAEFVETIGRFTSPDVSDQLNRMYTVCPDIHCLTGGHHRLLGPVCTVKVYPGDNLMVHKALDIAKPGDVVVVDASASPMNAVLGSLISMKARSRKIAGFIVDGYVRDLAEILPLDFPVFARGTTAVGPLHRGPGEINFPICCGGVVVSPGDIVLADQSGIAIVPRDHAAEICSALVASHKRSSDYFAAVSRGEFSNQWVDDILAGSGCSLEPGDVDAGGSLAASKS